MSSIEEMNRKITAGMSVTIQKCESSEFHINKDLIASIREYYSIHGLPTQEQIINHIKNIKVKWQLTNQ